MKKSILIAASLFLYATTSFASNIPAAAKKAMEQKFPNATDVKWGKESANNFEAEFSWQGKQYSANFSATGSWLETESPIVFKDLPQKVQTAFTASHKVEAAKDVSKIETSMHGVIYEIEVKKGIKTVELFYKEDGTVTKE